MYTFQGKPVQYRYIHENVWMPAATCDKIFLSMVHPKINLKQDYTKPAPGETVARYRDFVVRSYLPIAEAIINGFFTNGLTGAECANYFASKPIPSTEKKVAAARSKLVYEQKRSMFC